MIRGLRVVDKTFEGDITVVTVEAVGPQQVCPACCSKNIVGFGRRVKSVADLPADGSPVVLRVITRRFICKDCERSFYESPKGMASNRRMTDRLANWIKREAPLRRFTDIAAEAGLTEGTVRAVLRESGDYPRRKR